MDHITCFKASRTPWTNFFIIGKENPAFLVTSLSSTMLRAPDIWSSLTFGWPQVDLRLEFPVAAVIIHNL